MRRLANALLVLGLTIGVVSCIGLALGFRPSQLPAGLLDISLYKLAFVAAGSVLAAGAIIRRSEKRRQERDALGAPRDASELNAGASPDEVLSAQRKRDRERLG